ncbi:MAG: glycosyltransferase family 39 protein [Candidatus Shapirobacteria bacterium]|nr:glycosyltransferase family 39 protein [Candidatus Shapirobacteria bacterium]
MVRKNKIKFFLKNNWLIIAIWLVGLFLRSYRQGDLLGFYYDQGRDALMAQDIISGKNFPAIGPTTGIKGLYLGPFWFYLITPGYFFGRGNPAIASLFIEFLESLTIPLIYLLLKKYWNKTGAILAATFWSFSYYLILSSRWFSNPSPLPFFVLLIIYFLLEVFNYKKYKYWPIISLLLGLSLQLEAASAVFFIPVILVFSLINYRVLLKIKFKIWLQVAFSFFILLIPQFAFEFKNNFFITKNLFGFLTGKVNSSTGKSWAIPNLHFIKERFLVFYNILFSKLDTNVTWISIVFLIIFIISVILLSTRLKNKFVQILMLWLFIPLFLLLFFVGNYGNLYDYYLTGFFPSFIIIFSLGLTFFNKSILNKLLLIIIFILFFKGNLSFIKNKLSAGIDGPEHITFGNQKWALNKICQETRGKKYNFSVYVPPYTPYSYDYLMNWYVKEGKCSFPIKEEADSIFLIYEVDPANPERLNTWLQDNTATIKSKTNYGGVHVQERVRNVKK